MNQTTTQPNNTLNLVHLTFIFHQLGDQVCCTGLPEIIFKRTGAKSVITEPSFWAFNHNPYVVFMTEEEAKDIPKVVLHPDTRFEEDCKKYLNTFNNTHIYSQNEFMASTVGIPGTPLRHPRLYKHEDSEIIPDKIVVHTTGSNRERLGEVNIRTWLGEDHERVMTDDVISAILNNYKNFKIVQIGGKDDKPVGGNSVNLCGKLDYWESAKEISEASIFIGVMSGPMHLANCYPRVNKRIFLMEFPKESLLKWIPGEMRNFSFSWADTSNIYFNRTDEDIGTTFSYTKI